MTHSSSILNALIFHNQTVLPRTSPGFGEVSLAVAELQGGNYDKAAMLAEKAVGKDPGLAAGWLAKTAADVFEATPEDLRKDRAIFCMDRALECAPSCHAEIIGFFISNILGHYVEVLSDSATGELGIWMELEAQAMAVVSQAVELSSQATGLAMDSIQLQSDAVRLGAAGLVTGLTALFSQSRGVQILSGVASAATLNEADRRLGDASILGARANALRVAGNDMRRTGGELRLAAAHHRAASMLPLVPARDLIELAARLARAEGLPGDVLDPLIDHFTNAFREVLSAHCLWLQQKSLPVFGKHPESQSVVLSLMRILPGMKRADLDRLVSLHLPEKPRRKSAGGPAVLGLVVGGLFEVLFAAVACSSLAELFVRHVAGERRTPGDILLELSVVVLITFGLDRLRAASFRRLAGAPPSANRGTISHHDLLRRGLIGEEVAVSSAGQHAAPTVPAALSGSTNSSGSQVKRVMRFGATVFTKFGGSIAMVAAGVLLFWVKPPQSEVPAPGGQARPAPLASRNAPEASERPPLATRRALPAPAAPPLPTAPASTPAAEPVLYMVAGIDADDTLNVRSGPGTNNAISARLPNGYGNIQIIAGPVLNGTTPWVQIKFGDRSGWVTRPYLTPQ